MFFRSLMSRSFVVEVRAVNKAYSSAVCGLVMCLLISGATDASPATPRHRIEVDEVVKVLGSDDRDLERIKTLAHQPVESARLLVRELHPVTGIRIPSWEPRAKWKDTLHVVWCIRALRYITGGLDFRAATAHHFGTSEIERNREWFVGGEQFRKDRTVCFFGVWMSRDSTYIAPHDAQIEIIREWRAWYEQHGKTFSYVDQARDQPPEVWYF
jgi:hypothetical protein